MDINDAISLPLLRIRGRQHEAHPQTRQRQDGGQQRQPRPKSPSQRVKILRRGVMKQFHGFTPTPDAKPPHKPRG